MSSMKSPRACEKLPISKGRRCCLKTSGAIPGWRVLGGLFATRKLVALGLGVPQEQMLERYLTLEDKRIPPEIVSSAPCKEIKWTGDQVDLSKLPIVTHASKDCGPYVTIGVQVGKDPDTGIRNLSIHRMLVLG